jgi:hypothetical protein
VPDTVTMGKIAVDHAYYYGAGTDLVRLGLAEEAFLPPHPGSRPPHVFHVKLPLPDKAALEKMALDKLYTKTLAEWYEDAKGDEEALRDELGEWRDNLESGNLGSTPKFDEVQEAADGMEAQELPELPDKRLELQGLRITVPPVILCVSAPHRHQKKRTGRGWRHGENLGTLEAVVTAAREYATKTRDGTKRSDEIAGEVEEWADEVQTYFDEVEGVSFPGMY